MVAELSQHETEGVFLPPAENTPENVANLFDKISDAPDSTSTKPEVARS